MAFLKTAKAMVVHPNVNPKMWGGLVKSASMSPSRNLSSQVQEILGGPLDLSQYLVTHCSIVASVDVRPVPGVKTGTTKVGSKTIDRRWTEYLVTPDTDKYINNNQDCFSREVLAKSYRTFVAGHNFQEHVQIEEQSKGRIIDAVARDIGESMYVDILIATNRKHAQLIQDIESGNLNTLSMGCVCDATQCTKCGNVAVDETHLCDCIKYEKGNYFHDEQGLRRRVAELCGHPSMNETGGVRFIEASWVKVPAFTGAVMRNILAPTETVKEAMRSILSSPPPQWGEAENVKAASMTVESADYDFPADDGGTVGDSLTPPSGAEEKDPLNDAEEKLYTSLRDRVVKRIEKDLSKKDEKPSSGESLSGASTNENITRMGYANAIKRIVKSASSDVHLVNQIRQLNDLMGVSLPMMGYRVAASLGDPSVFKSPKEFHTACEKIAGRQLTLAELRVVIRVGSLLARRARICAKTGE